MTRLQTILALAFATVLLQFSPVVLAADSAHSFAGKSIYFVVGASEEDPANDDYAIKRFLEERGASVRLAAAADSTAPARGSHLIMISSTADARVVRGRFRDSKLPVITWNAYLYPELGMTGDALHEDFSVVRESVNHNLNHASFYSYCVNAEHPISRSAGLPAGMFLNFMFSDETDMNWGNPTLGADVISITQGDPSKAAVFVYERGSLMDHDFQAPARRAGFFLGDDGFRQLSYAEGPAARDPKQDQWFVGRDLFVATLEWLLAAPATSPMNEDRLATLLRTEADGKKVLFLRRENLPWPEGEKSDTAHLAVLAEAGFNVTINDQTMPEEDASNYDLIIVSATTNKYKFGTKYTDAPVPVVLLEGKSVDAMKMAGRRRWTDYGTNDHKQSIYPPEAYVKIMRPSHPMSAGFGAGLVRMYSEPGLITWSMPAAGATVIATIPNQPHSAAIYGYEKGVTMANDAIAPAKRVLFPVDFNRFHKLSDDGLRLYRAVLLWSLSN